MTQPIRHLHENDPTNQTPTWNDPTNHTHIWKWPNQSLKVFIVKGKVRNIYTALGGCLGWGYKPPTQES